MTRLLALAPDAIRRAVLTAPLAAAGAFAIAASAAGAQEARPGVVVDIVAQRGQRDGVTAADTTPIGGYVVLGALTGFVAGFVGSGVGFHNNSRVAGAVTLVPFVWTVVTASRKSRAAPPPDLAARIQTEPVAYQQAFRSTYAQRLAQRRKRATITSGVVGTLVGFAALVALAFAAISSAGT